MRMVQSKARGAAASKQESQRHFHSKELVFSLPLAVHPRLKFLWPRKAFVTST
jgi:hypothetical protein